MITLLSAVAVSCCTKLSGQYDAFEHPVRKALVLQGFNVPLQWPNKVEAA